MRVSRRTSGCEADVQEQSTLPIRVALDFTPGHDVQGLRESPRAALSPSLVKASTTPALLRVPVVLILVPISTISITAAILEATEVSSALALFVVASCCFVLFLESHIST